MVSAGRPPGNPQALDTTHLTSCKPRALNLALLSRNYDEQPVEEDVDDEDGDQDADKR